MLLISPTTSPHTIESKVLLVPSTSGNSKSDIVGTAVTALKVELDPGLLSLLSIPSA